MKKDYIEDCHGGGETDFIERFWTARWAEKGINPADLRASDEWKAIKPFMDKLPANANILDAGCGTGEWTVWLAAMGHDVTGADISAATVAKLQAMFPGNKFIIADVRSLDAQDGSFNAVISWGVFEHYEAGFGQPLKETLRMLKPGGYLFMSVPFHNPRHLIRDVLSDCFRRPPARPEQAHGKLRFYQWRMTRNELANELLIAGFEVCGIRPIHVAQGISRFLNLDLKLASFPLLYRVAFKAARMTKPLFRPVSHMILACARKPE
ncbi:MAG: methyltransferase domain-containing protein [Nitrospinae bacterium]|nr:methyltransferase domain-containing protein [Nitrospinota bacterium]